ncbi:MAG: hypothetical protein P1U56_04725 [Saprospiraceae bacterium]|nr:hypothetical protein [Saprospiraceae bacterium]
MKNKYFILFAFLYSQSILFGQQSADFLFFSNGTDDSKFIKNMPHPLDTDVTLVSLGDNGAQLLQNIVTTYPDHTLKTVIGDRDINQLVKPKKGQFKYKKSRICPDPFVQELDDQHVMITLNSNWFIDREYKFKALNYDCDFFNEIHLLEGLEDILEDYKEWNKIIVAHHGIESISEIAGKGLGWYSFIPFYGQMYQSFRKNIGNKQDFASKGYHRYISFLSKITEKFDKLCIISGHDHINHVIHHESITHINVNSSSIRNKSSKNDQTSFLSKEPNLLQLKSTPNGWEFSFHSETTEHVISNVFKSTKKEPITQKENQLSEVKSTVKASEKYDASAMTRFIYGSGYREEWSTPVTAPLLKIDEYDGGLRPYAIGGGLQTMSIKFKSKNGKKYAFRVLDKQPEKSLSDIIRESIYRVIVQEMITTMHPYGPLVANKLLDATDIIHIKPELFILERHPDLEEKYHSFIGKIGTLEEKPSGKKKNREGFYGADKVVSSYDMFISLRKSYKNKIDPMAYAKARLMDMWLGDWDRHEDNWKWAMFKEGDYKIYKPIPKDRDHVFSKWSGFIPNIADYAVSNAEDFGYHFGNMRHLNFKARFLDRELAGEVSLDIWLQAAQYLQSQLTDEVIHDAVLQIPGEVYDFHAKEIEEKLISRRTDLSQFIQAYYKELNRDVYITGTNKSDWFEIHRQEDGKVRVRIYDQKKDGSRGPQYYQRILQPEIVQKIYCFGLDGKDKFDVSGDVKKSIKVRILGGSDKDQIRDVSQVSGKGRLTQVYDTFKEDSITSSNETVIKRPSQPAHYDPYAFDYNWLIPIITIRNSSGNGFGIGGNATYIVRGFNKPGYAKKWTFGGVYYPELKAHSITGGFKFRHFIGKTDLQLRSRYSSFYDKFPFFYGIGNDTKFDRENRRELNSIDYDIVDVEAGLETTFAQKSTWYNRILFENHDVTNRDDIAALDTTLNGYGKQSFFSLKSALDLDFTNNSLYPEDGAQFSISLEGRTNMDGKLSSNFNTRFSYFKTFDLGLKTTLIGSLHYNQANGTSAFYHLSKLGSQTHFRGYTRNRFIDKYAMLYNSEARVILGTIKTPLIQFVVGVFGFYDGGKVWNERSEFSDGKWNNSYGGGIFFAPGFKDYTISFLFARPEDDFTYSKFQIGFDF